MFIRAVRLFYLIMIAFLMVPLVLSASISDFGTAIFDFRGQNGLDISTKLDASRNNQSLYSSTSWLSHKATHRGLDRLIRYTY